MATTDTTPGTDSIRVPASSPAVLSRADSRIIWLLLGAAFVAILNETTMGVAIPHLITDLGITAVAAQWLTTAFMLTMAVVIPISGFLLQRFTTREVFIAAMGLFSLGIGMGYQVGDSAVRTNEIRRLVIAQSLLAYLFGAVIIGTVVNLVIDLG